MKKNLKMFKSAFTRLNRSLVRKDHIFGPSQTILRLFFFAMATANHAQAQWTSTTLYSVEGRYINIAAISLGGQNGQQVGSIGGFINPTYFDSYFGVNFADHYGFATLWNGTPSSLTSLHPAGAVSSIALGTYNGEQVGAIRVRPYGAIQNRASLWNGRAESLVDIHPLGYSQSAAVDIQGSYQVGWAANAYPQAGLWKGTAQSWQSLHPTNAVASTATGLDNGQQVGWVANYWNGGSDLLEHASLWSGDAQSWVDLHPSNASSSVARAIHAGQQVGWARINGQNHASLWTGLTESWVDLHPDKARYSRVFDVFDGHQVGHAAFDRGPKAGYWNSTAESWVDLSAYLPQSDYWLETSATSIWSDGSTVTVTGYGYNSFTKRSETLIWTRSIPEPTSSALVFVGITASLSAVRRRRLGYS